MTKKQFNPDQFQKYSVIKPPNALLWSTTSLLAAVLVAALAYAITEPYRERGGDVHSSLQQVANILLAFVFVIPIAGGFFWWYKLGKFTARKENALSEVFREFGWGLDATSELEKWPTSLSSIIHDLSPDSSWQIPSYARFGGKLATNPAECVLLDARYFRSPTKSAFIYLHVALRNSYPHTIIDGKDGLFMHDMDVKVGNVEKLSFEGELHKYFKVMTVKNSGKDAFYVFTPDLLEHVLDYGTGFNIEVIGNSLYVFAKPTLFETADGFASFMNLGLYLVQEFNQKPGSRGLNEDQFKHDPKMAENRMDLKARTRSARARSV